MNRRVLALVGLLTVVTVVCFCSRMAIQPEAPLSQRPVEDLIRLHRSRLPMEQTVIVEFRKRGASVVPFLVADLWTKDTWLKLVVFKAHANLPGFIARRITPPLPPGSLRQKAWLALMEMGPNAREAVPGLTRALTTGDPALKSGAAQALANMGSLARPALPALIRAARSPDTGVRQNALRAATLIAPGERAVFDLLLAATDDPDPRVSRMAALGLLPSVELPGPAEMPALLEKLQDPRWREVTTSHRMSAQLARWLGTNAVPWASELIFLVGDNDIPDKGGYLRREALDALRSIGPVARAAQPAVVVLCDSTNVLTRASAAMVMAGLAGKTNEAVEACLLALEETGRQRAHLRNTPLRYLAQLGPVAHAATPLIRALLKDCPPYDRVPALRALWKIEGDSVAAEVVLVAAGWLESDGQDVPRQAAELLGEMGPLAAGSLPELLRAIKSTHPNESANETALAAVRAIEKIDPSWLDKIGRERTR